MGGPESRRPTLYCRGFRDYAGKNRIIFKPETLTSMESNPTKRRHRVIKAAFTLRKGQELKFETF